MTPDEEADKFFSTVPVRTKKLTHHERKTLNDKCEDILANITPNDPEFYKTIDENFWETV